MTVPKRHHYVPQMILKGFTDADGWLYWGRPGEKPNLIRKARPAELFHQRHLYSTLSQSGIKDPAMEKALSTLKSGAVGIVEAIVKCARWDQPPELSPDQKRLWYMFFLMQWRRTPETQRSNTSDSEASRMIDELLDELRAALPHKLAEIETLASPEAKARTIRNVRVQSLLGLRANVMSVLERRGIAILRVMQPGKQFIVGSRPVVKLTTPGCTDLADPRVEMWLPISADIAVGVGRGDGGISLVHTVDNRPVRQLNLAIAKQSSIIAAGSEALVRSIADPR